MTYNLPLPFPLKFNPLVSFIKKIVKPFIFFSPLDKQQSKYDSSKQLFCFIFFSYLRIQILKISSFKKIDYEGSGEFKSTCAFLKLQFLHSLSYGIQLVCADTLINCKSRLFLNHKFLHTEDTTKINFLWTHSRIYIFAILLLLQTLGLVLRRRTVAASGKEVNPTYPH